MRETGEGFGCRPGRTLGRWAMVAMLAMVPASAVAGEKPGASPSDFFEARVRPVLVDHCYRCHSAGAKSLKGGLRLDTADGMVRGGDSGPAVVPGDLEASLLIRAVRYDDDQTRMPPKQKLSGPAIEALEQWVRSGAVMPHAVEAGAVRRGGIDFEAARSHWAYQPIRRVVPPPVKDADWPASPVDRFVLARMEAAGLTPSPSADRRTWLRRVSFDLVGLPPTLDEIEAFEADRDPGALVRVVDRLLASPRYGERWARHWLDVARYADTKDGVLMFGHDRVRPFAYTYRDYVIRAFNEDLPFDQFIVDQIAADVAVPADRPWRLAAMGFLTLGKGFDNNLHDQIDDRIDVVTRGFLGLTVACARCHDHKYDAIPTADYYALYGVFASSEPPMELPPIDGLDPDRPTSAFEKKAEAKRAEIRAFLGRQYELLSGEARRRTPDYLVHVVTTPPDPLETAIFFRSLAPEDLRPQIVARWRRFLRERARPDDPIFGLWHDLMAIPPADLPARARSTIDRRRSGASGRLNPIVAEAMATANIQTHADGARAYGEMIRRVDDEARKAPTTITAAEDPAIAPLRAILADREGPASFPESQTYYYMSRGEKDSYGKMLGELDRMAVEAPDARPRAMVLRDAESPHDPRIFVRGNPGQPGDRVPRQFLRILAGEFRRPFPHGSGRLDLARAIASPDNPITARVIVNRVWMHHFGEPMVATPSDFGTRSTPPTHPELLDFLAARLIDGGWSIKDLHRAIVLSRAYGQSSRDRPDGRKIDPENKLLWRQSRRRLDFEAMRDAMLFASGRLDVRMRGPSTDLAGDPTNRRRTLYGLVDRQSLPTVFRAFDFASPDQSAERRPRTTVPQQALFGMNAPFAIEQARALAARSSKAPDRIAALYREALGRAPAPEESEAAARFLDTPDPSSKLSRWEQLAQVLLMTNEFLFID